MALLARIILVAGICALRPQPMLAAAGAIRPKFVIMAVFRAGAFHEVRATAAEGMTTGIQHVCASCFPALEGADVVGSRVDRASVGGWKVGENTPRKTTVK